MVKKTVTDTPVQPAKKVAINPALKKPVAKSPASKKPAVAADTPTKKKLAPKAAVPKKPQKNNTVNNIPAPLPESEVQEQRKESVKRARELVTKSDLADQIKLFIVEYTKDGNAKQAAIRSGYSPKTAESQGARLLSNVKVKQLIDEILNDRVDRGLLEGDALLSLWNERALADPNSLTQYRRVACRYCFGKDHRYHFTASEMEDAKLKHEALHKKLDNDGKSIPPPPFDEKGGVGYVGNIDPYPDCPECWGEGIGREFFTDSRKLSDRSRKLYAGVKRTKDGIEILTHSQTEAEDRLARNQGLYKDKLADALGEAVTREVLEERFANVINKMNESAKRVQQERGTDT